MEIEINFRFDENGRTANTTTVTPTTTTATATVAVATTDTTVSNGGSDNKEQQGNTHEASDNTSAAATSSNSSSINYGYNVQMTQIRNLYEHATDTDTDTDTYAGGTAVVTAGTAAKQQQRQQQQVLDELLLDCEISDYLMMPRTYWVAAVPTPRPTATAGDETASALSSPVPVPSPRCSLEQFAWDIFHHHVPANLAYDPATSGAEWWCQLKTVTTPTPATHSTTTTTTTVTEADTDTVAMAPAAAPRTTTEEEDKDPFVEGISFHVDKDEELRLLTGYSVHPHVSTVTYLTTVGSPTLMVDCQVHPLTGAWLVPSASVTTGFVSWPFPQKHISFDGRYLHAAPPDLHHGVVPTKAEENPRVGVAHKTTNSNQTKQDNRRQRRVTFLVNIWLNYRPYDVHPFPASMITKMSGHEPQQRQRLHFPSGVPTTATGAAAAALNVVKTSVKHRTVTETADAAVATNDNNNNNDGTATATTTTYDAQRFVWPLGDGKTKHEALICEVPFRSIQEAGRQHGNVLIEWHQPPPPQQPSTVDDARSCFRIVCEDLDRTAATTTTTTANTTRTDGAPPLSSIASDSRSNSKNNSNNKRKLQ